MGYYQIRTSEVDMEDREVIDKYHGLSRIENQFEELKGPLETRPVYVKTKEHIHAHLLICMIALVMFRLIQRKYMIKNPRKPEDHRDWIYGMSGRRVQKALQKGMDEKPTTKNELPIKTLSSQRKLPIPDYVFEAILEERKKYERNRSRRKYGDNANIIPEEIPELLSYMNEVMPKKEGNDGSDVWEIVIDLNGFLPSKDNS